MRNLRVAIRGGCFKFPRRRRLFPRRTAVFLRSRRIFLRRTAVFLRSRRIFLRRTAVILRRNTALPWNSLLVSCRRVFKRGTYARQRRQVLNAAAARFHGTYLFFHETCASFHGKAAHFYAEARFLRRRGGRCRPPYKDPVIIQITGLLRPFVRWTDCSTFVFNKHYGR